MREDHKFAATPMYRAQLGSKLTEMQHTPVAGLNQPVPFYLNLGYALPAYECWTMPNILTLFPPVIPVCYTRTLAGSNSNPIDALKFDIFPSTIDGFMTMVGQG